MAGCDAAVFWATIVVLLLLLLLIFPWPGATLAGSVCTAPFAWSWPLLMGSIQRNRVWGDVESKRPLAEDFGNPLNYLLAPSNNLIRRRGGLVRPFYSRAEMDRMFPQHEMFERAYPQIRAEALALLRDSDEGVVQIPEYQEVDRTQKRISSVDKSKKWKTFVFKFYGSENKENCARCPITASLVRQCPSMKAAMFSILDPGFRIPPHRGPSCAALRYHLGVIVPEPGPGQSGCFIRVDGNKLSWRNGEGILFDDTYVHEVVNDTSKRRVVLFCDVMRPDLPTGLDRFERAMADSPAIQTYFAKYNRKNEKARLITGNGP